MADITYLWDPVEDNVIAELDEGGGVVVEYTTEPEHFGNVVSQRRDGETNCFYSDGIGSTTEVTDAAGDSIATRAYSGFGESTETSGDLVFPFQFVGQKGYYCDTATGDYYVRQRLYSAPVERWLSVDPLGLEDGLNVFWYCHNRPLVQVDPPGTLSYVDSPAPEQDGKKVAAHEVGKCGKYSWYINWDISETKGTDGYIVQQVDVFQRIRDCCDKIVKIGGQCIPQPVGGKNDPVLYREVYYEVWKVSGDKFYVDVNEKEPKMLAESYHDLFSWPGMEASKGCHSKRGEAIFLTKLDGIADLKSGGVGSAGILFAVCKLPKGWTWANIKASKFKKGKTAKRVQEVEWNCCRDNHDTTEKHGTNYQLDNKCAVQ